MQSLAARICSGPMWLSVPRWSSAPQRPQLLSLAMSERIRSSSASPVPIPAPASATTSADGVAEDADTLGLQLDDVTRLQPRVLLVPVQTGQLHDAAGCRCPRAEHVSRTQSGACRG